MLLRVNYWNSCKAKKSLFHPSADSTHENREEMCFKGKIDYSKAVILETFQVFKIDVRTFVDLRSSSILSPIFPLVRFDCRMARFPTQIKEVTGGHDHLFISKLEV